MEIALCRYLNYRVNLVAPNVSWGMFTHECDLIRLTPSGDCTEIEIKVDLSDLKKDKDKAHLHRDGNGYGVNKIKYLYFAIPDYLERHIEYIPEMAGILVVKEEMKDWYDKPILRVNEIRKPKKQSDYKFTEKQRTKLLELLAMRIWKLKIKLSKEKDKDKYPWRN